VTPGRAQAYVGLSSVLLAALAVNLLFMQPTGIGTAQQRGRELNGRGPGEAASLVPGTPLPSGGQADEETTRAVQRELHRRGYYPGPLDGGVSLLTSAAVMGCEHDGGLPLTGAPSESVLKHLLFGEVPPQGTQKDGQPVRGTPAEHVVREVQRALARLGYGVGRIDARLSEETVRAIREFEMDQGLKPSGRVSAPLILKLSQPKQNRTPSRP
jgi:peptidoglycan hydrolase-like protein with peptidoglycan-binding domain